MKASRDTAVVDHPFYEWNKSECDIDSQQRQSEHQRNHEQKGARIGREYTRHEVVLKQTTQFQIILC